MVRVCCSFIFGFNTYNRKIWKFSLFIFKNNGKRIQVEFSVLCSVPRAIIRFSGLCNRIIVIGLYEFIKNLFQLHIISIFLSTMTWKIKKKWLEKLREKIASPRRWFLIFLLSISNQKVNKGNVHKSPNFIWFHFFIFILFYF